MLTAAVIALLASPSSQGSGAAVSEREQDSGHSAQAGQTAQVSRSDTCRSARKALTFYRTRYASWLKQRGVVFKFQPRKFNSCPWVRTLAKRWKVQAHAARVAYERWYRHEFAWRSWLPPVWKRLIACETFSNFRHNSGTYQGAFGFHYGSWDRFKLAGYPADAFDATPRQQYEVALAIWGRFGLSGWGCANG